MKRFGRRTFASAAGLLPTLFGTEFAQATLLRGMSLSELTRRSAHVVLITAEESRCSWALLGGRRVIITETRARIEEALARQAPDSQEVLVRTLGGVLDGRGQLVHGQAVLSPGERSVAFLTGAKDGTLWVTGMAQGHYPVVSGVRSSLVLSPSPHLPTLVDFEHSGVHALVGRELSEARRLVREMSQK